MHWCCLQGAGTQVSKLCRSWCHRWEHMAGKVTFKRWTLLSF